ncbi:MAG: hypothetical protein JJE53_00885 [Candidatus Pacebacteria bacterium]|nr:hypothetical protein [Candidatus Paceibacterota bacterium]
MQNKTLLNNTQKNIIINTLFMCIFFGFSYFSFANYSFDSCDRGENARDIIILFILFFTYFLLIFRNLKIFRYISILILGLLLITWVYFYHNQILKDLNLMFKECEIKFEQTICVPTPANNFGADC